MPTESSTTDLVIVRMHRTYGYQGKYYGPGAAVAVPRPLALSMHLQPADEVEADIDSDAAPEPIDELAVHSRKSSGKGSKK